MPINGNYTFNELISHLIEKYGMSEILDNLALKAFHSPNCPVSYPDYSALTGRLEKLTDEALAIEAGQGSERGQSDE